MSNWIRTDNGTLLPADQVIRIEARKRRTQRGHEYVQHLVVTEVGDQFEISPHELPTSGSFIGNHNPDLVILSVWLSRDEPDDEPVVRFLPLVGWSVMGGAGSEEAIPITIREQEAWESRGILDRRSGLVVDYDEQFASADDYIADVVRRRREVNKRAKQEQAVA